MKNFALIGAAGYIAPRHMQAIKETNNQLIAALDPHDTIGFIDSYFPDAHFFTEFERFDRHIDKLRRSKSPAQIDFVSICSPNYLHDSHIRFALRSEADAICEKPLVINPWNLEGLTAMERETGRRIHTILQLRLHPAIQRLKESIRPDDRKADIDLTYITSRGRWYLQSWKGDERKSGGVAMNIGVHFFDMLHFLFGPLQESAVHLATPTKSSGFLEFKQARVRWFLSIDAEDIPTQLQESGKRTYRSLTIDGIEVEFSDGFADLHTRSYERILAGRGFGLSDARAAIETVAMIRTATPNGRTANSHPMMSAKMMI